MLQQGFPSLSTSVYATGTCELPILEAFLAPETEASRQPSPTQTGVKSPMLAPLLAAFRDAVSTEDSAQKCFQSLQRHLASSVLLNGSWWLEPYPDNSALVEQPMRMLAEMPDDVARSLWQAKQVELLQLAKQALAQKCVISSRQPRHLSIAIPISDGQGRETVVLFSLAASSHTAPEDACVAMALALEQSVRQELAERTRRESQGQADWLQLQRLIDQSTSVAAAAIILVNYLKSLLRAEQVALLLTPHASRHLQVAAISDLEQVDPTSQAVKSLVTAATFIDNNQQIHLWTPDRDQDPHRLAFKQCAEWLGSEALVLGRLDAGQQTVGYLVIGMDRARAQRPGLAAYLEAWLPNAASHLALVQAAHASTWRRLQSAVWRLMTDQPYQWIRYGVALFVLALFIPWPYRVSTPCQMELVKRRYVAAPFDGLLETCFVQNGDTVVEGQRLALMEGRQLRLEMASKRAELAGQLKRRESHLARGDVAQSMIAQQQAVALQAEIELIQNHLQELEVRSPIDGVIVSGDLEKAEGAPLKTGDTMFEIGPLDQLIVELEISDAEVRFIRPGQPVVVLLDAFPMLSWRGEIQRIHPRAELRRQQHVFIAEVIVDNHTHVLRPGLRGRARIHAGWSPLGWNLFHKPLERIYAFASW